MLLLVAAIAAVAFPAPGHRFIDATCVCQFISK